MNVPRCVPAYSCVSKRACTVHEVYRQPAKRRVSELMIDSLGLKVFCEDEWTVKKHGAEKSRVCVSWAPFMWMVPMTAKPAISLSGVKGQQLVSHPQYGESYQQQDHF